MIRQFLLGFWLACGVNAAIASIVLNFAGELTSSEARICSGPSYECTVSSGPASISITYSLAFDYDLGGRFDATSFTSGSGWTNDQARLFPFATRTNGLLFAPQSLVPAFGPPNMTEAEFLAGQGTRHYSEWTELRAFRALVRNPDGTVRSGRTNFDAISTQDWFTQLADGTYRVSVTQLMLALQEDATSAMTVDLVYSPTTEEEFYGNMTRWMENETLFWMRAIDYRADSFQRVDSLVNYWGSARLVSVARVGGAIPEPGTGWLALSALTLLWLRNR